ncbi:methyltransferase [Sphingomonas sp. CARO-RG-8B-R24-01]|uniref:class I SAM-dependent methyltransferase n=1 Tax=Sphingomonas sp. CARO-RG-8B-R24-01 TaxID=2914831 RepID=UPI001F5A0354|nr:methyltransferase [Sphingomonas sp. CARO-RG-8B-R24-01]
MSFHRLPNVLAALLTLAAFPATANAADPSIIDQALRDPARAKDSQQDARRHPADLIALSHLARGQRVLDLIPGGGYWTRIFSHIVGQGGHVYAVWPAAYARLAARDVAALRQVATAPAYRNVTVAVQPQALPTAPVPLDVIWTSQNYHDYADPFLGKPGPDALARDAFRLLRPGGYFIVIDHRSAPGRGMADTDTLHRIDPVIVRRQVEAAGFVFAGASTVLDNTSDPLTGKVFDPSVRGRTSQFAFAFRKPGGDRR